MSKRYAPKPITGPLATRVKNAPQKKAEKAAIHIAADSIGAFTHKGITITVTSRAVAPNGAIRVWCLAMKDGRFVNPPPNALPLEFHGPPILVPDGTFRREVNSKGREVDRPNYREDPKAALEHEIGQIVARWAQ